MLGKTRRIVVRHSSVLHILIVAYTRYLAADIETSSGYRMENAHYIIERTAIVALMHNDRNSLPFADISDEGLDTL